MQEKHIYLNNYLVYGFMFSVSQVYALRYITIDIQVTCQGIHVLG
jgi:hypothetical protein